MLKLGGTTINKCYLGATEINKIYLGDTEVFGADVPIIYPNDISDRALWLDPSDAATITQSMGSVSQWVDKYGAVTLGEQLTGSLQPKINLKTINSLPAMGYDTDDFFNVQSVRGIISNVPETTIVVFRRETAIGTMQLYRFQNGGSFRKGISIEETQVQFAAGGSTAILSRSADTSVNVYVSINDGTLIRGYVNGGVPATVASTYSTYNNAARLGSGSSASLNGAMGEVGFYAKALSSTELNGLMNTYLAPKWGFTWTDIS